MEKGFRVRIMHVRERVCRVLHVGERLKTREKQGQCDWMERKPIGKIKRKF